MKCPECGTTVRTEAKTCSGCGIRLASREGARDRGAEADAGQGPPGEPENRAEPAGGAASSGSQRAAGERPEGEPRAGDRPAHPSEPQRTGVAPQQPGLVANGRRLLSGLPWRAGGVAGGLVSLVAIGVTWAALGAADASRPLEAATYLVTGLLEFTPPSELVRTLSRAGFLPAETFAADGWAGIPRGQYDALLGLGYLFMPWLLYSSGRQFAANHIAESSGVFDALGAGATVIAGTAPIVAVASVGFGGDVVTDIVVAGLVVPGGIGALAGLGVWTFRGHRRSPSWGAGFSAGLVGLALTAGLAVLWASPAVSPADALVAWLMAALAAFVGTVQGGFSAGGAGWLAVAAVALPVALFGYYRARRCVVDVADPIGGARAGATVVAGFSTLLLLALTGYAVLYAILQTAPQTLFQTGPAAFLPPTVGVDAMPRLASLGEYLRTLLLGGIAYPLLVGGAGGALGGYLETPTGSPAQATQGSARPSAGGSVGAERSQAAAEAGTTRQGPNQREATQRGRGGVAGLSRRRALGLAGGVVAVAGGWYLLGSGGGGGVAGETPSGTVEAFVQALDDGNTQRATQLMHPSSPVGGSLLGNLADRYQRVNVGVERMQVTERADQRRVIEATLSVGGQDTALMRVELRTASEGWRVYAFPGPG